MLEKASQIVAMVVGLISIIGSVHSITQEGITATPFFLICVCGSIICILFLIFHSQQLLWYSVYQYISFITRQPNLPYYVREQEIRYIYRTRKIHRNQRKVILVSKVDGLCSFTGYFRWSRPQPDMEAVCVSPHKKLTLGKQGTWSSYTVEFEPAPKGSQRIVDMLFDNLNDPNYDETMSFCAVSITEHTEKLIMTVATGSDLNFDLSKIRFSVYDNAASSFPVFEERYSQKQKNRFISYDAGNREIRVEEKYPIYGYKYQLSWDFQES